VRTSGVFDGADEDSPGADGDGAPARKRSKQSLSCGECKVRSRILFLDEDPVELADLLARCPQRRKIKVRSVRQ
jgi:hypothetical protein